MKNVSNGNKQPMGRLYCCNKMKIMFLFFWCSHWPTFPQIFINGEFIGGSDIILNMHQVGYLLFSVLNYYLKETKSYLTHSFYIHSYRVVSWLKNSRAPQHPTLSKGMIEETCNCLCFLSMTWGIWMQSMIYKSHK